MRKVPDDVWIYLHDNKCCQRRRIVKGDKIKLVNADDLQSFLDDGWLLQTEITARGRITPGMKGKTAWNKGAKISEEQKKILSERAKGKIWINNGVENKMIYPDEYTHWESLGYSKGRTKFSKHKKEEE